MEDCSKFLQDKSEIYKPLLEGSFQECFLNGFDFSAFRRVGDFLEVRASIYFKRKDKEPNSPQIEELVPKNYTLNKDSKHNKITTEVMYVGSKIGWKKYTVAILDVY